MHIGLVEPAPWTNALRARRVETLPSACMHFVCKTCISPIQQVALRLCTTLPDESVWSVCQSSLQTSYEAGFRHRGSPSLASDFSGLNDAAWEQTWLAEDLPAQSIRHPVSVGTREKQKPDAMKLLDGACRPCISLTGHLERALAELWQQLRQSKLARCPTWFKSHMPIGEGCRARKQRYCVDKTSERLKADWAYTRVKTLPRSETTMHL